MRWLVMAVTVFWTAAAGATDAASEVERLGRLWQERAAAMPRVERDELALALNEAMERAALTESGAEAAAYASLASKYRRLRAILADDARGERAPVAYHPLEHAAVQAVQQEFGAVAIDPAHVAGEPINAWKKVEARRQPWAGYWYPLRGRELFDGPEAPLVKLDQGLAAEGHATEAAQWERTRHVNAAADAWEGLCGAWAVASIVTEEPLAPSELGGVPLTPGDQKALLTKLHEEFPTRRVGVRYLGNAATDGTYQDLRPEAFHALALAVLGRGDAFVVDRDPGIEVWQHPVFHMTWRMDLDAEVPHAVVVTARVRSIEPRRAQSDLPTEWNDLRSTTYTYRLYYDPAQQVPGGHPVVAGEWIGASLDQHPDFVVLPIEGGRRRSSNPEVNRHIERVERALGLRASPQ